MPPILTRRLALLSAVAVTLAAAACSETTPSPQVKAATDVLAALGLEGFAAKETKVSDGTVTFEGVTGRLDPIGAVKARSVIVRGAVAKGDILKADLIDVSELGADGGATVARKASIASVSIQGQGKDRVMTLGDLALTDFDGPLIGTRLKLGSLTRATSGAVTHIEVTRAKVDATVFEGLPELSARTLAAQEYDLVMDIVPILSESLDINVSRLSGAGVGQMSGTLQLTGYDPGRGAAILALGLRGMLLPALWPEGVGLRGLSMGGNVTVPDALLAFTGEPAEPALAAKVRALGERLSRGGANMAVSLRPVSQFPVQALPAMLATSPEASRLLGVEVTGTELAQDAGPR